MELPMSSRKKNKKNKPRTRLQVVPAKSTAKKPIGPRVLVFDIETAPVIAHVWRLWDQNVGLNQIVSDWHVLAWSAKWLGEDKVLYMDQSAATEIEDDHDLLVTIWHLLDDADIVITQNGRNFDQKKLNARFVLNKMQPPSHYKHIDTKQIASKHFGFTSNKLEYMTDKLCTQYKKLKHKKFPGHELWVECLAGNPEAWDEMRDYALNDVLSLEELYTKLIPWENTVNFNLYHNGEDHTCHCGSVEFHRRGFHYTAAGKYQCYRCVDCGSEIRSKENLLSLDKRKSLRPSVPRGG